MSRSSKIILSAASTAAAITSLAQIAQETGLEYIVNHEEGARDQRVDEVLERSQVQAQIRANLNVISKNIRLNGVSLSEKYADLADSSGFDDSVGPPVDFLQGCYTNCHSACHGSRSWR